jgi:AraC-like DNA-binding protein
MKVQAIFLKNLLDYAAFQQMDTVALKSLMANPDADLNSQEGMVPASDYINVLESIIEESRNSHCGLSIGSFLNLSSLGLVLEISLNTSSLKQGIYILEKFLLSKFPIVSFAFVEGTGYTALQLDSSVENEKVKNELLNMVMYIIYRELKLMLPNGEVPKIRFPFSNNEEMSLFFKEEVFHDHNHLIILPENLDGLQINVNRVKDIELLLPKFVSMLNQSDSYSKEFSKNVRVMTLNMCDPEIPNLKQVQKQFACSERTFQRRLTGEGTTFRNIVNEIKEELANYLSNEHHLKTKDIAYILGYSESSAYLHAQKEWKSKSKQNKKGALQESVFT